MSDLVILVPTRMRPHTTVELAKAFAATCTSDTKLVFCVDGCPQEQPYREAFQVAKSIYPHMVMLTDTRRGLVGTLNYFACWVARQEYFFPEIRPFAVGFLGDDHRPRTHGWDTSYLEALRELRTGVVYGDDLLQGQNMPTQMAMTTDIVSLLGYMAPPDLWHLYCDDYWRDLGAGAGCLRYMPEVVVEHMHPNIGKGAWDDSYAESNSAYNNSQDAETYAHFKAQNLLADIEKVRVLREAGISTG